MNLGLLSVLFETALSATKAEAVAGLLRTALESLIRPPQWADFVASRLPDTFSPEERAAVVSMITAVSSLALHVLERHLPAAAGQGQGQARGFATDPDAELDPESAPESGWEPGAAPAPDGGLESGRKPGAAPAPDGGPDCP